MWIEQWWNIYFTKLNSFFLLFPIIIYAFVKAFIANNVFIMFCVLFHFFKQNIFISSHNCLFNLIDISSFFQFLFLHWWIFCKKKHCFMNIFATRVNTFFWFDWVIICHRMYAAVHSEMSSDVWTGLLSGNVSNFSFAICRTKGNKKF